MATNKNKKKKSKKQRREVIIQIIDNNTNNIIDIYNVDDLNNYNISGDYTFISKTNKFIQILEQKEKEFFKKFEFSI